MNQDAVAGADAPQTVAARKGAEKQRTVRSIQGPWTWLRYSLLAFIVFEIALIASAAATIIFFDRVQSGYYETDAEIMAAGTVIDTISGPVGILYFVVYLVCAVSYARFFHRSMNNAKAAGAPSAKMSPGWVWGYLFIPILNLWKPLEGVMQVWRGSMERSGADPKVPAGEGCVLSVALVVVHPLQPCLAILVSSSGRARHAAPGTLAVLLRMMSLYQCHPSL